MITKKEQQRLSFGKIQLTEQDCLFITGNNGFTGKLRILSLPKRPYKLLLQTPFVLSPAGKISVGCCAGTQAHKISAMS